MEPDVNESVRKTYDQLVRTRNAQLDYMAKMRGRNKEFAFLLTPDLILQYNYIHQLMKSLRTGMPPDLCARDGGITCSNLSVLKAERGTGKTLDTFPAVLPTADASDYIASRIVDLLDRPVTVGDLDMTVNVRDEFAANIKTLNLLFEERYKLCHERGERLRNELASVKQQLAASRAAASDAGAHGVAEKTIERMREEIARYETQMRVVREQMDALKEINEKSIQRNRRDIETLTRRVVQSGRDENSDAFLGLFKRLLEGLETERDRVLAVVKQIQQVNERRSDEFSRLVVDDGTDRTAEEFQRRVAREVNNRAAAVEMTLRGSMDAELRSREDQLKSRFDDELQKNVTSERARLSAELNARTEELQRGFTAELEKRVAQETARLEASLQSHEQQLRTRTDGELARLEGEYNARREELKRGFDKEVEQRLQVEIARLEAEYDSRKEELLRRYHERVDKATADEINERVEREVRNRTAKTDAEISNLRKELNLMHEMMPKSVTGLFLLHPEEVERRVEKRLLKVEAEHLARKKKLEEEFDHRVREKVSQAIGTPVVTVEIPSLTPNADLEKYKTTLDSIFELNVSVFDVVPMAPMYELPKGDSQDYAVMNALYEYVSYLLAKMKDIYRYMFMQSKYLSSIGITAYNEFVPLTSMTRERTEKFTRQVDSIMANHVSEKDSVQHDILKLLNKILEELPGLKQRFDSYYAREKPRGNNRGAVEKSKDRESKNTRDEQANGSGEGRHREEPQTPKRSLTRSSAFRPPPTGRTDN
ncbi:hypothetical protein J6590_102015 [Homalodisca vitripennis]|nr:hypothetical protein J6590_102015 [Homalodisca vitripennis]